MTDETEQKMLALESLADSVGKKNAFRNVPLESLVYLTGLPEISGSELKFFLEGFFMGYSSKALISTDSTE